MSKLTKEDVTNEILERVEFVTGFGSDGWGDADPREIIAASVNAARELLSLRGAGDDEVEQMKGVVRKCIYGIPDSEGQVARDTLDKIVDGYIARGQQLREARAENEWLKGDNAALLKQWNDLDQRNEQWHREWNEQIATLTAERDEAQGKLTALEVAVRNLSETFVKVETERDEARKGENTQCTIRYMLQDELDVVKAELATLKSAPGMAEVDAILQDAEKSSEQIESDLADIARRSIASREEVVGLLDHILSCIITVRQENTPEWMEYIVEEVNKVNKAMGDSDRVELSRGDIVIVKGGSEIVEGNHA